MGEEMKRRSNLLIVITALIGLVLLSYSFYREKISNLNSLNAPGVLSAIATSLISSAIFAFLYKSKTDEYIESQIQKDISNNIRESITTIIEDNRREQKDLSPIKVFSASKTPIPEFNFILDSHLSKSTHYKFKGSRALYLSYRLRERIKEKCPSLKIDILLLDFADNEAFRFVALSMRNSFRYKGKQVDEIIRLLKLEQLSVLLAFYDIKDDYDYEICFINEVPIFRCEIMDDLLVLSPVTTQKDGYYSPAFMYSNESVFYQSYLTNFNQWKQKSCKGSRLTSRDISEDKILEFAGVANINTSIDELRRQYSEYCREYSRS